MSEQQTYVSGTVISLADYRERREARERAASAASPRQFLWGSPQGTMTVVEFRPPQLDLQDALRSQLTLS